MAGKEEFKPAPEKIFPNKIHLIGVGGDGMSGLAGILKAQGYEISGSEQKDLTRIKQKSILASFQKEDVPIFFGHTSENLDSSVGLVVRSSIIDPHNPEIRYATELGIPVMKRSEVLGKLMEAKFGIAIAGAAGKTTTTAMLGLILEKVGFDPTVVLGARLKEFKGKNFRYGKGSYFVTEADEFDRSFLDLRYKIAVVTNIFWGDHLDYYKNEGEMLAAFAEFIAKIPSDGYLIACGDDDNIRRLLEEVNCQILTYGFFPGSEFQITNIRQPKEGTNFEIFSGGSRVCEVNLQTLGKHNVLNAMAAILAAQTLGISFQKAVFALSEYQGVTRRLEIKGIEQGVTIIDDFAHNPTQIKAVLEGLRQRFTQERIWAVFQPRQFRRTKVFLEELATCFDQADKIIVADISRGIGDTEVEIASVHSRDLVERIKSRGKETMYIGELEKIAEYLKEALKEGDVLITLGTGNVYQVGEEVLRLRPSAHFWQELAP